MGLRINTNLASLTAQKNLGRSQLALERSLDRLSSGLRITRASDDAAGLAISETLRAQIRGLRQIDGEGRQIVFKNTVARHRRAWLEHTQRDRAARRPGSEPYKNASRRAPFRAAVVESKYHASTLYPPCLWTASAL